MVCGGPGHCHLTLVLLASVQALESRQQLRAAQQSAATAQESVRLRLADMQEELQLASSRAEAQSQLASALHVRVQQLESEVKECKESLSAAEATLVARLAAQRQALQEVAAAQAEQHAIALEEVSCLHWMVVSGGRLVSLTMRGTA